MQSNHFCNSVRIQYICAVLLLIMAGIFLTGCGDEVTIPSYDEEVEPAKEVSLFAVVSNLDEVNGKISLKTVDHASEITLEYTGGVDVRDKYGDILSMSQVELGSVVDAVYDENRNKLLSLYISSNENIQVFKEVSGAEIDYLTRTLRLDGKNYRIAENAAAFSDNKEIGLDEICSEDQLTLWLYHDEVCSVFVELGHGYVRLSDYASYLGGMVEIGYDVIVPVTEDMLLTVREGEYTLRIAKGDDVGTKKIEVIKNQEVDISLADLVVEPKQIGSVLFKLTPSDAQVYIDGRRINTEGAVELVYGRHKIYIVAESYDTYSGSLNVNFAYKVMEYKLKKTDEAADSKTKTTQAASTENETTTQTTEAANNSTEQQSDTSSEKQDGVKDVNSVTGTKTANKVTVSGPVGASVYFDGEYLGIAPMSFTKVTGSHIITLSQTGYLSKSYTVTFSDDGKDETLTYDALDLISSLLGYLHRDDSRDGIIKKW